MGNGFSFRQSDATGTIVYWDGSVKRFDKPLTVAELMLEHPQQVVVEFHSGLNQKRPTPLPADKNLETKKIYLMLPIKRGKPIGLCSEESRRILLVVNSVLNSKPMLSSLKFVPLLARMCPAITSGEVAVQKKEDREKTEERHAFPELILPEMLEGRPEYLSRQLSGKGWKPSLDTIKEKKIDTRVSHWLFLKIHSC
ncbi:hypothetical protein L6164_010289 [Bauhinia variegata]|uniref:Uncharacterized protein n=1 Tax=Bauhinia variegata TaxID=167791 RepID=A0ACB9PNV6_BAUVA|nr:hypothetical protein L6164_010289 [Bauhinia variegata]